MNDINTVKSCFRRERPESAYLIFIQILVAIFYILLFPLVKLIKAFACIYGFILIMDHIFTGKEREKYERK